MSLTLEFLLTIVPCPILRSFLTRFLTEIFATLKKSTRIVSLLPAILGSAYFLFLGSFIQLNIIPFAVQSLQLSDVEGGYLFLITALGIGTGAMLAGKISGKTVELALVPISATAMAAGLFLLDYLSDILIPVVIIVFFLGLLGGLYQIPLDTYIQVASPSKMRGQAIAATNFMSFVGVLLSSILIYMNTAVFDLQADKGFTIMGFLTIGVATYYSFQFFDYVTRFIGMILSMIHFETEVVGEENIPDQASLYLCNHSEWNDTLLMLWAQKRRMRFFIEAEQEHQSKLMRRLYRMLRVIFFTDIEPSSIDEIRQCLSKGISVCILVENTDISSELQKLKQWEEFSSINAPVISVEIEKGEKQASESFFTRLFHKVHVPAKMEFETLHPYEPIIQ